MPDSRQEKHLIVPIFIPHQGCPYQCIYCRQDKITDKERAPASVSYIKETLDTSIKSSRFEFYTTKEVAFYGGTFTNLPKIKMKEMLESVAPYLRQGLFNSIRVSTRPDAIDDDRLQLMRSYGVSIVELGVQSMDDDVLRISKRGHLAGDTIKAFSLLKKHDFKVGVQLMPGLPGDSESIFKNTIEKVIDLGPDMARIYPAIVIKGTELASIYNAGRYSPLTLNKAIMICSEGCITLEDNGIPVIRIGLMSSPSLLRDGEILAGPWHSAFGFLVRSYIHHKKIDSFLPRFGNLANIGIKAPIREIPLVRGYKNEGIRLMEEKSGAKIIYIKPDDSVAAGWIEVEEYV